MLGCSYLAWNKPTPISPLKELTRNNVYLTDRVKIGEKFTSRTECGDAIYGAIGRAVTVSTHFESNCRALALLLHLPSIDSEEFSSSIQKLWKRTLNQQICAVVEWFDSAKELSGVLHKARKSRNFITHELTLSDCEPDRIEEFSRELINRVTVEVRNIAEADRDVCLVTQVLTHEPIPTHESWNRYPMLIEEWVFEMR